MKLKNKIFIKAYLADNLGDDLFLKILFERYPQSEFILYDNRNYKCKFSGYHNVWFVHPIFWRVYNVITQRLGIIKYSLENIIASRCKATVLIGGSMFIEPNICQLRNDLFSKRPFYILGVNFGPYSSEKYLEYYMRYFADKNDVCFREYESYKLFEVLKNARYESDIACIIDKNCLSGCGLFVSVMNFKISHQELAKFQNEYENWIVGFVKQYIEAHNISPVYLSSFCEFEGDMEVAERINRRINQNNVKLVEYSNNIDEIINIMNGCDTVIATRYHSVVLGVILGKKVIPISYSGKTDAFLNSIGFVCNYNSVKDISNPKVLDRQSDKVIDSLRTSAELQFAKLDEFLW